MIRLRIALTLVVLIIAGLVATGALAQEDEAEMTDACLAPEAAATEAAAPAADNSDISFAIILPNQRGDRSFIDAAARGAERAIAELGVEGDIIETAGEEEHDAALRRAVRERHDLIIAIGVDSSIIQEIAEEFPDQKFAAQQTFFPEPPDLENLALYTIYSHESSYLVGIAAGMLTRTGIVGAVGGVDDPAINLFIVGFEEGVRSVCPDCQTLRSYVGDFADPVTGKEQALAMYAQGADILFQAAGRSGEGVLQAADETDNFAIGVDSNQDDLYPGNIILSAMVRVDNAVFNFVESVVNDNYAPGTTEVGLPEGFTGLSWDEGICSRTFDQHGPEDMVAKLPEVRAAIEEARAGILSGEIHVTNALLGE